jgi:hypothetical protein
MTIKIVEDGPDVTVTRSDYNRFAQEHRKAFQMYVGPIPTLEQYIRQRLQEQSDTKTHLLTEDQFNSIR